MVLKLVIAAAVGVVIGILSGLLGIGGGTVMVPVFRLAFGMSAVASTATSLFTIIPTSISGVVAHVRNKTCKPVLGIAMGLGGACTSPLGVWIAQMVPGWIIMLAAAIVIGYSAFTMIRKAFEKPRSKASLNSDGQGQRPGSVTRKQLIIGFGIGLIAGIISGFIGVGGGFIMVPLMLSLIGIPMKQASGTSLIAVVILAVPGAITQGVLGNIDYLVGIATAIGSIPGAFLGARMVTRVPERMLRILFACFLGVGAILLVVKELGVL